MSDMYIELTYVNTAGSLTKRFDVSSFMPVYNYVSTRDTNINNDTTVIKKGWSIDIDFPTFPIAKNYGTNPSTIDLAMLTWIAQSNSEVTLTTYNSSGAFNLFSRDDGIQTSALKGYFEVQPHPRMDTSIHTFWEASAQFKMIRFA